MRGGTLCARVSLSQLADGAYIRGLVGISGGSWRAKIKMAPSRHICRIIDVART